MNNFPKKHWILNLAFISVLDMGNLCNHLRIQFGKNLSKSYRHHNPSCTHHTSYWFPWGKRLHFHYCEESKEQFKCLICHRRNFLEKFFHSHCMCRWGWHSQHNHLYNSSHTGNLSFMSKRMNLVLYMCTYFTSHGPWVTALACFTYRQSNHSNLYRSWDSNPNYYNLKCNRRKHPRKLFYRYLQGLYL